MAGKEQKPEPMSRIWDALGAIIITAVVVKMVLDAVTPYAPFLIIGVVIVLIGRTIYDRQSRW